MHSLQGVQLKWTYYKETCQDCLPWYYKSGCKQDRKHPTDWACWHPLPRCATVAGRVKSHKRFLATSELNKTVAAKQVEMWHSWLSILSEGKWTLMLLNTFLQGWKKTNQPGNVWIITEWVSRIKNSLWKCGYSFWYMGNIDQSTPVVLCVPRRAMQHQGPTQGYTLGNSTCLIWK